MVIWGRLSDLGQRTMIICMTMKQRKKISRGGQISIPAAIRRRWDTATLTLDDQGSRIVLEPASDDPVAAADGALAGEFGELDLDRLRQIARENEHRSLARRTFG